MPPKAKNSATIRANASTDQNAKTTTKGRKRKSTEAALPERRERGKQAKKSDAPEESNVIVIDDDDDNDKDDNEDGEERKPRLTTPDLEFDYDREQLRDPRPTPGRVKRPRLEDHELTAEFKRRFYIPGQEKPKGRLSAYEKEKLHKDNALMDPTYVFHDLHVCHKKGRNGSPTYDAAGFRLDWKKVDEWMRPQPYNKNRILKGVEKAQERHQREKREIYDLFFVDGKGPELEPTLVLDYVKDHVSKDLGVPWHQIGPKQLVEWEKRGFPKQKAEEWWRMPNEEEQKRMLKMLGGASLRKDLKPNAS
ncbi:hypothetical protein F4821DRAFT_219040 [Hypoxylon rubiginosum]|uniref:Uncharacterized protein n=1 Tax=Hypoxylon rubiginosum TaxID=110542 RepID=A0ACC0CP92_9PEZI|nr:hypothetical protein F4821DRAFT_219040 [Hypoxylon rubiginosum]